VEDFIFLIHQLYLIEQHNQYLLNLHLIFYIFRNIIQ